VLQIANNLKAEGYIKSKTIFITEVILAGDIKKLKAGTYDLKGSGRSRDRPKNWFLP